MRCWPTRSPPARSATRCGTPSRPGGPPAPASPSTSEDTATMTATRVAAIDCGTNSIRLLIADDDGGGRLTDIARRSRIVRLGQDVDRTGRLATEAIERVRVALADYAALCAQLGVERVRMAATSDTPAAENRATLPAIVRATCGVDPEVASCGHAA